MQSLAKLVETLKSVRERKEMYFQPVTVEAAESFLGGFRVACLVSGAIEDADWLDLQESRGWKSNAMGPVGEMRERGLTEEQIIDELIELENIAFQRSSAAGSSTFRSLGSPQD